MSVTSEPKLIRVDRNGTKYYVDYRCPKCGGTGYINGYEHIDGARCWKCNATGYYETKFKEYTPEYAQKLADRRRAKALKGADERNAKFLAKEGFSADGKAWLVCGDTYSIKDELKNAGAKYSGLFGWHFDHETKYTAVVVDIKDFAEINDIGNYWFGNYTEIVETVKELKRAKENENKTVESEYVGEVGDKVEMEVTYDGRAYFDTAYGTTYIHRFVDSEGNKLVWRTGNDLCLEEEGTRDNFTYVDVDRRKYILCRHYEKGDKLTIKGTIKDHSEYRGEKQTSLTRCKVRA